MFGGPRCSSTKPCNQRIRVSSRIDPGQISDPRIMLRETHEPLPRLFVQGCNVSMSMDCNNEQVQIFFDLGLPPFANLQ